MKESSLKITPLSSEQEEKVQSDLRFISLFIDSAKQENMRVIISGGYAVDGVLGKVTRPHNDIDIQIFGNGSNPADIIKRLSEKVSSEPGFDGLSIVDKGREPFYHTFFVERPGLGADIYYVQVVGDPFEKTKQVIKSDGSLTEVQNFDTSDVSLNGVQYEAVNATNEIVDKIYKREMRGDANKAHHQQDIENLWTIVDRTQVDARLNELLNRKK